MGLCTSVVDGKIYAIGGSRIGYPPENISMAEEYDPGLSVHEMGRLREGLVSATETFGAGWKRVTTARCGSLYWCGEGAA